MNPCNEWHKRIVKCIDNEAHEDERAQMTKHIQICSACQAFHAHYTKFKKTYKTVVDPVLSCGIREELLDEIKKDSIDSRRIVREPRSRPYTWGLTLGRAAAIFLFVSLTTACTLLARSNSALKKDLEHARQEVSSLHQQKQFLSAQSRQQEAITELNDRVRDLEGHIQYGLSPRTAWYSKSSYYQPDLPGKL